MRIILNAISNSLVLASITLRTQRYPQFQAKIKTRRQALALQSSPLESVLIREELCRISSNRI